MKKFKQPVSMPCTQEQFEKDLKKPLEEMGYNKFRDIIEFANHSSYIFINWCRSENGKYSDGIKESSDYYDTYHIDHYNPELFLAIAAMTEGEEPIVGEWVILSIGDTLYIGKFLKMNKDGTVECRKYMVIGIDDVCVNGVGLFSKLIRKATLEELVDYLGKKEDKFVLPEKWCVKPENTEEANIIFEFEGIRENEDSRSIRYYQHFPPIRKKCTADYVINSGYTEITFEQFKKYVLKETTTMETPKTRTISRKDAQRIIDIACSKWKETLADRWAKVMALNPRITITEDFYKEMRAACTAEQNKLFDEIFGKDETMYEEGKLYLCEDMDGDKAVYKYTNSEMCFFMNNADAICLFKLNRFKSIKRLTPELLKEIESK